MLTVDVFVQVLKQRNIPHYRNLLDTDDVMRIIASHLGCSILSDDSDFLMADLFDCAIVRIRTMSENNFQVCTDEVTELKYIKSTQFKLDNLLTKFPGLKAELLDPIAVPLLNQEISGYLGSAFLKRISRDYPTSFEDECEKLWPNYVNKGLEFYIVFEWLSKMDSFEQAIKYLQTLCNDSNKFHFIVESIRVRNKEIDKARVKIATGFDLSSLSIEKYFSKNKQHLFIDETIGIPKRIATQFVDCQINRRLMVIYYERTDIFGPLIEDYSLHNSSYQCIFKIAQCIYAILRKTSNYDWNRDRNQQYQGKNDITI